MNSVDNSYLTCLKLIEHEFENLGIFFEEKKPKFITKEIISNIIKKKLGL